MTRRAQLIAASAAVLIAVAGVPATAQVSLQPPGQGQPQKPKSAAPAPPAAVPQQRQAAPAPAPGNPFAAVLGPSSSGGLNASQRAIVDRVSAYLSSLQVLSGQFVQVGPDGRRSKGDFYIQKPGKIRFEYDDPNPTEIVADGSSVVVRDRNLATQDVYPLSQTPLRFLLADRLDLVKDTNLVAVYADETFITVVVEESAPLVGKSRMMLMFGANDTQLKQWTITDPQGFDTTVAVYNLDPTRKPDPSLFRIDYTRYK